MAKIIVIEDEKKIARFIELELKCEGYEVLVSHDGMEGLIKVREENPDLVILDRLLPNLDGIQVCKRIRKTSDIPIIILTAKTQTEDKIEGLDSGANDYMVKPFNIDELLARIRAHLRTSESGRKHSHILSFDDISLNKLTREVKITDRLINLSTKEYELLEYFLSHPHIVINKESLMQNIWGWDYDGDYNVLEVYIHNLREKLEKDNYPRIIQTIRGVGYILKLSDENKN